MKRSLILAMAMVTPCIFADEVKMKDGTVYKDCTIDSETDTEYHLLVPVSKSIKDSVTVLKENVESVVKSTLEELAIEKLNKKYKDIDTLDSKGLEEALKDLEKTVAATPKEGKTAEIYKTAFALQKKVKAKLDAIGDKEKAAAEAKEAELAKVNVRNKYDFEANRLLERMKKLNVDGKQVFMMEIYDRLRDEYPGTEAVAQGYVMVKKVLPPLNDSLKKQIATLEKKLEKERTAIQTENDARRANGKLTPEQREALQEQSTKKMRAISDRETKLRDEYRAIRDKLREKQYRWFNPPAGCLDAMKDLQRLADTEVKRIKQPMNEAEPYAGEATKAMALAWELADAGKFDEAREQVQILKEARVPGEYYEELDGIVYEGQQDLRVKEREERAAAAAKERERISEEQRLAREGKKPEPKADEGKADDSKPSDSSKSKDKPADKKKSK